jgi:hypothetical protein
MLSGKYQNPATTATIEVAGARGKQPSGAIQTWMSPHEVAKGREATGNGRRASGGARCGRVAGNAGRSGGGDQKKGNGAKFRGDAGAVQGRQEIVISKSDEDEDDETGDEGAASDGTNKSDGLDVDVSEGSDVAAGGEIDGGGGEGGVRVGSEGTDARDDGVVHGGPPRRGGFRGASPARRHERQRLRPQRDVRRE